VPTQRTPAPSSSPSTHRRPAFDLFEGYALSNVLAGLEIGGLLPTLEQKGLSNEIVLDRAPEAAKLLVASLRYLADRGLVRADDGGYVLTEYGREVCADKGYLLWLVGGYGEPLSKLDKFVTGAARYGLDYTRNGEWVAGGAAMLGRADVVPYAIGLLKGIEFTRMVDIGCGNARFLLLACQQFGASGVGVDLSPEACQLAEEAVARAGMQERVQISLGDAEDLDRIPGLAETDLVVTFFLLHEVLGKGRTALVDYLRELSDRLPPGAHLLVAEVEPPDRGVSDRQWFTPEFTYVHAVMSQILYTAEQWTEALTDGGFEVVEMLRDGMPGGLIILGRKPVS
jgi:SAM-dependent methyltransferase